MARYIIKRLLQIIPVIIGVAILIFTIMYFVPGDPAQALASAEASEAEIEALREQMGLNEPYIIQLKDYLIELLHFDLGTSYQYNSPVIDEIVIRFPRTLVFALCCMVIRVAVGIPLGMSAAVHQNKLSDRICMFFALVGISLPDFWVGLMLVLLFAVRLGWLPAYGIGGLQYYILPAIAGSLNGIAVQARHTRSSMLEVIRSDYVATARAKGIPEKVIIWKHVLPNAMIPVLQALGNGFGMSLGGAIVLENVFAIPGIGMYLKNAVSLRDYPVVRGCVVLLAITFSLIMLVVDIIFAYIDPRIKAKYVDQGKRKIIRRGKDE